MSASNDRTSSQNLNSVPRGLIRAITNPKPRGRPSHPRAPLRLRPTPSTSTSTPLKPQTASIKEAGPEDEPSQRFPSSSPPPSPTPVRGPAVDLSLHAHQARSRRALINRPVSVNTLSATESASFNPSPSRWISPNTLPFTVIPSPFLSLSRLLRGKNGIEQNTLYEEREHEILELPQFFDSLVSTSSRNQFLAHSPVPRL